MTEPETVTGRVAIVLAIHRPDLDHLAAQIASIREQTHTDWVCVIVSDGEARGVYGQISEWIGEDQRFVFYNRSRWSGVLATFADGLRAAPDDAEFFAFCDQDDVWHREKLALQVEALRQSDAALVHCDARVVGPEGALLADSMVAAERRPPGSRVLDIALRNNVTGMTAVFTRDVRAAALPFPSFAGFRRDPFLHDTWIALSAGLVGNVKALPDVLVDYRQHDRNYMGVAKKPASRGPGGTGSDRGVSNFRVLSALKGIARDHLAAYNLFRLQLAYVTARRDELRGRGQRLVRLESPMDRRDPEQGLHMDWALVRRAATGLFTAERGRVRPAVRALLGRQVVRARSHLERAGIADQLRRVRRRWRRSGPGGVAGPQDWQEHVDRRMVGLAIERETGLRRGVVVLLPSLNATEIFAGIATALDLAMLLAARGIPVRVVATDMPVADPTHAALREILRARLAGFATSHDGAIGGETDPLSRVTFVDGTVDIVRIAKGDSIIATAWWTCYKARDLIAAQGEDRAFYYLIQDYEPLFYPWSEDYAHAMRTYAMDMVPVFNSTYLASFFGERHPDLLAREHHIFRPAVLTEEFRADLSDREPYGRKRVMVYGRPSVARNLFSMAVWALGRWIEAANLSETDIELVSLGEEHPDVLLPNGVRLVSKGKLAWEDYKRFAQSVDIGLSLMLSPHPSHIPLELAAAGAVVVTNAYGTKDLGRVSSNIVSVAPDVDAVSAGLAQAFTKASDLNARARAAEFDLDLGHPLPVVAASMAERIAGEGGLAARPTGSAQNDERDRDSNRAASASS